MDIRIGNQTARSAMRPAEPFEYAMENAFDAFEWFMDSDGPGPGWRGACLDSREVRKEIFRQAREHGIRLSLHAPCWIDPFQPEGREVLCEVMCLAQEMGAAILNLHIFRYRGIKALSEVLTPMLLALLEMPLRVSIENTPDAGPEDFNELFARLVDLEPRFVGRVGLCLDLGHANLSPGTRNDYVAFIDQLAPHVPVNHVHLHENYGDVDSHMTLFTGPSSTDPSGIEAFIDRLKKRNYHGSIILEQWPDPPGLLVVARDRLLRMFGFGSKSTGILR